MAEIDDNELQTLRASAARVTELESDATLGREYREAETKRIAKLVDGLPANDRKLLDGVQDLKARSALAERLFAAQPQAPAPIGGGSPPPPGNSNEKFAAAWAAGGSDWERVRAQDPEGARRWVDSQLPVHARNSGRFPF
jgi:hypothetical protein